MNQVLAIVLCFGCFVGEKCAAMPRRRESETPLPDCVIEIDGKFYGPGAHDIDPCTRCTVNAISWYEHSPVDPAFESDQAVDTAQDLEITGEWKHECTTYQCYIKRCPVYFEGLPCVDAIVPEGECCRICPNGANCRTDDGDVVPTGTRKNIREFHVLGRHCTSWETCTSSYPEWQPEQECY